MSKEIRANLELATGPLVLGGSADPTSAGVAAPLGSLYLRDDGTPYRKTGAGNTDWSTLTGGGSLTHIDSKFVTADTGDLASVTFTGLDGDADGIYFLWIRLRHFGGFQGSAVTVRPNGTTADQETGALYLTYNGSDGSQQQWGGWMPMKIDNTGPTWMLAQCIIYAKTGMPRFMLVYDGTQSEGFDVYARNSRCYWNNAVDNITSLEIASDNNPFESGCSFHLYKLKHSNS